LPVAIFKEDERFEEKEHFCIDKHNLKRLKAFIKHYLTPKTGFAFSILN
jgi:hypothetical protein